MLSEAEEKNEKKEIAVKEAKKEKMRLQNKIGNLWQQKAGGSSRNGRDSAGRRLGVKKYGGQLVVPGNILLDKEVLKYFGENVGMVRPFNFFCC